MSNNSISRKSSDYSDPVPAGREAHGEQAAGDVSRLVCCMPARDWREALPLGNGSLAALVYGRTAREVVTLNHEKLWGGASTLPLPDVSDALPDIRRALADGHYQAAENLLAERLVHEGYYAASPGAYMPGPDLLMQSHGMLGFSDYE